MERHERSRACLPRLRHALQTISQTFRTGRAGKSWAATSVAEEITLWNWTLEVFADLIPKLFIQINLVHRILASGLLWKSVCWESC
ncbi:uncharacterized protein isoform X3 [Musca autumnalis]|uniref:uncharacterized protein isoform X3 n=1 Tax=Musca autumnalis TaxID=221902 RepID=UPI003CF35288